MPICLEWLETNFKQVDDNTFERGNIAVVGLMNSKIEFWDLDVLDPIKPLITFD